MSASEREAEITTAASAGCGRSFKRPGTATSISTIAPAPTRPATWLFAPACTATRRCGSRSCSPGSLGTTPPPRSRRRSRSSPGPRGPDRPARAANEDAVEMVSARATNTMPNAPRSSSVTSDNDTWGIVNGGNPLGSGPTTDTPESVRSNAFTATIDSTTASEDRRDLRHDPFQRSGSTRGPPPRWRVPLRRCRRRRDRRRTPSARR